MTRAPRPDRRPRRPEGPRRRPAPAGGPGGPRADHRHDRRDRRPLRRQPRRLRDRGGHPLACSTRRATRCSGTSATRPTRTRSSPAAATARTPSASTAASRPFCSIHESEHDIMGAGHASTSVSYAVGLKEAMRRGVGEDGRVVAVIGDGALTGGVAFEALHNAGGHGPADRDRGERQRDVDRARTSARCRATSTACASTPSCTTRARTWRTALTKLPAGIGERIERLGPILKESLKAYWAPGLFFEELDLAYVGVIDGHDVKALREAIGEALEADRPVVVHCKTVKGKGFAPAEDGGLEGMEKWHAAKPGSIVNGDGGAEDGASPSRRTPPAPPQYTKVFGDALVRGGAARRAGGGHHRRDELRHRPEHPPEGAARALLRRGHRRAARGAVRRRAGARRARSRWPRSTRPSSSAASTRSSTTSASRASTWSSRWTAPAWWATTGPPTTAPSTSPTCAACRTWC